MSEASFQQPDRRRPEPLWYQVEEAIRAIVKSGEWATGDQIPAEDRLCALFGVSRITLRHALRNLEESGLLRREHGRGTFVRSATLVAGTRELTSFTQEMGNIGVVAGSRLLDCSLTTANAAAAGALEIEEGDPIVRIRRLRLGNNEPIGI
jgi:GntR family transcriptional regulator